jgi:hypothetical protein
VWSLLLWIVDVGARTLNAGSIRHVEAVSASPELATERGTYAVGKSLNKNVTYSFRMNTVSGVAPTGGSELTSRRPR